MINARNTTFLFSTLTSLFLSVLVSASTAHASYVEADLESENGQAAAQPQLGTHVVIAGRGLEAGTTWLMAAHTQALIFRDRARHGSIRLLAALDPNRKDEYLQRLQRWGYRNVRVHDVDFTANELIARLSEPQLIASIDFIGHDGAFLGLALEDEGGNHRFYKNDAKKLAGKARFSPDAFIRLLGCNTGWFLAPYMAKVLGVPTRGTLTSADVQLLYGSETVHPAWYFDEDGRQPKGANSMKKNAYSYESAVDCIKGGGCVRLKAINASYVGQHGQYAGALPFGKFFCGSVPRADCFRRMALSAEYAVSNNPMSLSSPNAQIASLSAFAETLADDLCPAIIDPAKAKVCHDAVVAQIKGTRLVDPAYTTLPLRNPQLSCDFQACAFHLGADDRGQKVLISDAQSEATTFSDELNAYRTGFGMLAQ